MQHRLPADIERSSLAIIRRELEEKRIALPAETEAVVCRVIHATADFDYAQSLRFTPQAVEKGAAALSGGAAHCFMAEDFIAAAAKEQGTTRAVASMAYAAEHYPEAVYAIGNAPTALFALADRIEAGLRPALVIAVPVGFVNVVESKERLFAVCERCAVPAIAAMGRKGGSSVAAAICNALIYTAADLLDPSARGWQG